jgi:hypothetical protein
VTAETPNLLCGNGRTRRDLVAAGAGPSELDETLLSSEAISPRVQEASVCRFGGPALLAAAAVLLAGASTGALGQQPDIVGTWEWTRSKDGCSEQYVYRQDGTLSIRRGEKRTENAFRMSWAPEPNGRYGVTIFTVKDDGRRDCEGSDEDTAGRQRIVYLLFGQSRETMIQCESPTGADCTGLMRRVAR